MPRRHLSKDTDVPEEEIRQQLDRILDHGELQSSVRRRELLKFIVEETLAGRSGTLKATTIALAVFARGPDFDQQSDPVVRLEARKLRRDLDTYYSTAGQNDPIRITIPKGHYIPEFEVTQNARVTPTLEEPDNAERSQAAYWRIGPFRGPVIASAVVILAAVIFWTSYSDKSGGPSARFAEQRVTILVDTFDTRSRDETVTLVASGLTSEIAAALIKFPDFAVHLQPVHAPSGLNANVIANELPETEFTVTGEVWQEEGNLFVRSNLIRRDDMEILWSRRFEQGPDGESITGIQDAISSEIASAIGQQYGYVLRDVREKRLDGHGDPSLRGFSCVASAQIYRRTYNRVEYPAVRECLEATVLETPNYARAWAMLAYVRNDAARFGHDDTLSREAGFELARRAAARAVDLDPEDTDALQAMSHVEQYAGDIERSIEFASKAVEVNPNDPAALANLALRYGFAGRFSEGVPIMKSAIERSVAPPPFYFHLLASDHLIKQEWRELLVDAQLAATDGWSFGQALLAIAYTQLSNDQLAQEAWQKLTDLDPNLANNPKSWLAGHKMPPNLTEAIVAGLAQTQDFLAGEETDLQTAN